MQVKKEFPIEAIILAGGMGTRLKEVVKDIPKPMAPVNGKPFLYHLMKYLSKQGVKHFILSVGYRNEVIKEFFENEFEGAKISYAVEEEPLGTGGAIKLASTFVENNEFWVINGDTFVGLELSDFYSKTTSKAISLGLVEMSDFDRYGKVETDKKRIISFKEKEYTKQGFINSGIYLISKKFINNHAPKQDRFSFEKDILEKLIDVTNIGFYKSNSTFIDIGIPEDFYRSQKLFSNNLNAEKLFSLDSSWTIFLDRDGVINKRLPGSYVKTPKDFQFLPKAKQAIKKLSDKFDRIVVVTNQQGLGKGLMTEDELKEVNNYMISEIEKAGGNIDNVYYCAKLNSEKPNCRKPNPDMALMAKKDYPEIDFSKSIIIGDSISDMEFGKNLGMQTILIPTKEEERQLYPNIEVDWRIEGLFSITI